jgi:hypothetical protein
MVGDAPAADSLVPADDVTLTDDALEPLDAPLDPMPPALLDAPPNGDPRPPKPLLPLPKPPKLLDAPPNGDPRPPKPLLPKPPKLLDAPPKKDPKPPDAPEALDPDPPKPPPTPPSPAPLVAPGATEVALAPPFPLDPPTEMMTVPLLEVLDTAPVIEESFESYVALSACGLVGSRAVHAGIPALVPTAAHATHAIRRDMKWTIEYSCWPNARWPLRTPARPEGGLVREAVPDPPRRTRR